MPGRHGARPAQLVMSEVLLAAAPPPPPVRPPDAERARREARSAATLAGLLRNLASGTVATATEGAGRGD